MSSDKVWLIVNADGNNVWMGRWADVISISTMERASTQGEYGINIRMRNGTVNEFYLMTPEVRDNLFTEMIQKAPD